jgi:hypothetical protein
MMFGIQPLNPEPPIVKTVNELIAFAKDTYGEDAEEFLKLCASSTGSISEMLYKATRCHMELGIRLLGRARARTGENTPIYYWVFNPDIPGWDNPGSFHSSDLWFFFETLAKCWRPFTGKHYDLARKMCNYWLTLSAQATLTAKMLTAAICRCGSPLLRMIPTGYGSATMFTPIIKSRTIW